MKKYRRLFISMAVVVCFSLGILSGCEKEAGETQTEAPGTEQEDPQPQEPGGEQQAGEEPDKEDGGSTAEVPEERTVTLYYVDEQTAEVTGKQIDILDEYDIWAALKENGILTEDCELLSLNVNESEKKMDLDFNLATGDRIRSMGTTGETQIIGCIVNTYLEAYACDGIRLTEEGQPLQTSHGANYDGYSGKITF